MNIIYFFVEGQDDERFVSNVLIKNFPQNYSDAKIIKYRTAKKQVTNKLLKSISRQGLNYLFMSDFDDFPCITKKKEKLLENYPELDKNRIFVVRREIESWYLAGVSGNLKTLLKKSLPSETAAISKEDFSTYFPKKFDPKIDKISFMCEILKSFSISDAKVRNNSFAYFLRKQNLTATT